VRNPINRLDRRSRKSQQPTGSVTDDGADDFALTDADATFGPTIGQLKLPLGYEDTECKLPKRSLTIGSRSRIRAMTPARSRPF
jgi:hypothetical protein